jgi:hypothetical protein
MDGVDRTVEYHEGKGSIPAFLKAAKKYGRDFTRYLLHTADQVDRDDVRVKLFIAKSELPDATEWDGGGFSDWKRYTLEFNTDSGTVILRIYVHIYRFVVTAPCTLEWEGCWDACDYSIYNLKFKRYCSLCNCKRRIKDPIDVSVSPLTLSVLCIRYEEVAIYLKRVLVRDMYQKILAMLH